MAIATSVAAILGGRDSSGLIGVVGPSVTTAEGGTAAVAAGASARGTVTTIKLRAGASVSTSKWDWGRGGGGVGWAGGVSLVHDGGEGLDLGNTIGTAADDTLVDVADTIINILPVGSTRVGPTINMGVTDLALVAATIVALLLHGLVLVHNWPVNWGHNGLDQDGLLDLDHLGHVGHDLHVSVLLVQRVNLDVLVDVVDRGDTDVLVVVVVVRVLGDRDWDGDPEWDVDHSRL